MKKWYGNSGLQLKKLFNISGLLYKSMHLKDRSADMSDDEQFKLLSPDGMLVKMPILISDDCILIGFKEAECCEKLL